MIRSLTLISSLLSFVTYKTIDLFGDTAAHGQLFISIAGHAAAILDPYTLDTLIFTQHNRLQVCYRPYGCFSDEPPYDQGDLVLLPIHPDVIQTKFSYFSRKGPYIPRSLDPLDEDSPTRADFDPSKTTVIFTHGYLETHKQWYINLIISELLKYEDMNVIFCDWSRGAFWPYHQAVGNVRLVGTQMAHMVEVLYYTTGVDISRLRLIGFSLGAHVVGTAGRLLRERGILVSRITGLDPAAPYFENKAAEVRLDPTDADFVDIIHTDSKTLFFNGLGTTGQQGHLDFYPNGGYDQVGCAKPDISVLQYVACSHYRSVRYFIESINAMCSFYAYPCSDYATFLKGKCTTCPEGGCPRMGFHSEKLDYLTAPKFYLQTQTSYPFCGHHYKIGFYTGYGLIAGFKGEVKLEVIGSAGMEIIQLKKRKYKSGSYVEIFMLFKNEIGEPERVRVSHTRYIYFWYLEAITVRQVWSPIE